MQMMKAEEIINILKKINYWSVELWSKLGAETIGITKPDMFSHKFGATPYRWGKVERGKIGISPLQ